MGSHGRLLRDKKYGKRIVYNGLTKEGVEDLASDQALR
jgi:hypothetical protein